MDDEPKPKKQGLTVEEIIEDLRKEIFETWPEEAITDFFLTEYNENNLIMYHHSLGRYIRNMYGLWGRPWEPKIINGVDTSPEHPDAISMTIMREVWKRGQNNGS